MFGWVLVLNFTDALLSILGLSFHDSATHYSTETHETLSYLSTLLTWGNRGQWRGRKKARQWPINPRNDLTFSLLHLVQKEKWSCWNALQELRSCTNEIILFFFNGETSLGVGCCIAIRAITCHCWPTILTSLGPTWLLWCVAGSSTGLGSRRWCGLWLWWFEVGS